MQQDSEHILGKCFFFVFLTIDFSVGLYNFWCSGVFRVFRCVPGVPGVPGCSGCCGSFRFSICHFKLTTKTKSVNRAAQAEQPVVLHCDIQFLYT